MVYGFQKYCALFQWLVFGPWPILTKIIDRHEPSAWTQRTIQENPSRPATAMWVSIKPFIFATVMWVSIQTFLLKVLLVLLPCKHLSSLLNLNSLILLIIVNSILGKYHNILLAEGTLCNASRMLIKILLASTYQPPPFADIVITVIILPYLQDDLCNTSIVLIKICLVNI